MAGNSLPGISCKWQIRFLLLRRKKRNILKLTGLYSMRKICSPAVLCLLLCFLAAAGCGNKNRTAGIQMTVLEFSGSLELKLEHFLPDGKVLLEQLPGGFDFSSGAGGWATYFNLHTDGTFTGRYHDSDMGDAGTGYSAGTVYVCNFDGKFSIPERTGRYTYAMTLEYLNGEGTPGTEYYEDNIRYIYQFPHSKGKSQGISALSAIAFHCLVQIWYRMEKKAPARPQIVTAPRAKTAPPDRTAPGTACPLPRQNDRIRHFPAQPIISPLNRIKRFPAPVSAPQAYYDCCHSHM